MRLAFTKSIHLRSKLMALREFYCWIKSLDSRVDIKKKMDRLQATLDALMLIRGPLANALQKSSESKTNPNFIEQSYRELTGGLCEMINSNA